MSFSLKHSEVPKDLVNLTKLLIFKIEDDSLENSLSRVKITRDNLHPYLWRLGAEGELSFYGNSFKLYAFQQMMFLKQEESIILEVTGKFKLLTDLTKNKPIVKLWKMQKYEVLPEIKSFEDSKILKAIKKDIIDVRMYEVENEISKYFIENFTP